MNTAWSLEYETWKDTYIHKIQVIPVKLFHPLCLRLCGCGLELDVAASRDAPVVQILTHSQTRQRYVTCVSCAYVEKRML